MRNTNFVVWSLLLSMVLLTSCASSGKTGADAKANSDEVKLMVLYPKPTDVAQFDKDYQDHLQLLHEKVNISDDAPLPYTVTKFFPNPERPPAYYQVFIMKFASAEALQQAMSTSGMQEVAADAARISSGGPPVVMVGSEIP